MLIREIRGGFIGHEFHEFHKNDHRRLDCHWFAQPLRPRCLTPKSRLRVDEPSSCHIECVTKGVNTEKALEFEKLMAEMASDPCIRSENAAISREFATAEMDGLKND